MNRACVDFTAKPVECAICVELLFRPCSSTTIGTGAEPS